MRTTHLVFASILAPAAADTDGGRGLGSHGVDALESWRCLERWLNGQWRAQTGVVDLPPREGVSNWHLGWIRTLVMSEVPDGA